MSDNPTLTKAYVAGQMDAQATAQEKRKVGAGGPLRAMSRRAYAEAEQEIAALTAQVQALTEARDRWEALFHDRNKALNDGSRKVWQQAIAVVEQLRVRECYTGHHLNRAEVLAALRAKSEKGDGT